MKRITFSIVALILSGFMATQADACTGISLRAEGGSRVVARTVEWAASPMQNGYVIAPRGHKHQSYTPSGLNGLEYKSIYGYVGLYTEYEAFVVEGINEAGLSAGLFFFPGYGDYTGYDPAHNTRTLCDMQFVSWVLSQFSNIEQVKEGLRGLDLVTLNNKIGSVHWRITEPGGKMVVLEVVGGVPHFYENKLGVLTNAPGFLWHTTNLKVAAPPLVGGNKMIGTPGDFTSPSRYIRAAFMQSTAPTWETGYETVLQAFHILNNFDIQIGVQHERENIPKGLPSATQFTSASDLQSLKLYYRTCWNSNIRCIDLMDIDFHKVKYQSRALDVIQSQPIEVIKVR